MSREDA
jgi:hypothetical protein